MTTVLPHSKKLSLIAATVLASVYIAQASAVGTCDTGTTLLVDGCTLDGLTGESNTVTGTVTLSDGTSYSGTILGSSAGVGTVNFVSGTSTITGGLGTSVALATVAGAAATGTITGALVATNVTVTSGTLTANKVSGNSTITTATFGGAGTIALNGATNALTTVAFANQTGTLTLAGGTSNTISGNVTNTGGSGAGSGKGTLNLTGTGAHTITGTVGLTGTYLAGINAGAGTTTLTGAVFTDALTTNGTNKVTLSAASTIGTLTYGGAGSVVLSNNTTITTVAFGSNNGTLTLASGKTLTGKTTTSGTAGAGKGNVTFSGTGTISGDLGNASGGGTHLASIDASSGAVTAGGHLGADSIALGGNTLTMSGEEKIAHLSSAAITLTAASETSYGNISNGTSGSVVTNGSTTVAVTTGGYIRNGARLTIASGYMGTDVASIGTITTNTGSNVVFTQDTSDTTNLVLVASRPYAGSTNNHALLAAVADPNIPLTSDLSSVLYIIDQQSSSDAVTSYKQLIPQATLQTVLQGTKTAQNTASLALATRIASLNGTDGRSGMSAGDVVSVKKFFLNDGHLWIKGFGTFAHQNDKDGINGYNNHIVGTMLGVDGYYSNILLGAAGSYASSNVKVSDATSRTNINSYQGTLYGLRDMQKPFYMDGSISFAWNDYKSTRSIVFTGVNRSAQSDYDGQQYSAQFGGGYKMKHQGWNIVPHAAVRYSLLHVSAYTETNAGDLNLNNDNQNYDALITDLAVKINKPQALRYGIMTPELRVNYSRDFLAEAQSLSSHFTGGGPSFVTTGARTTHSTIGLGAGLGFASKGRWSAVADYDVEFKNDYHAQSVMVTGKMQF